jgi:hypothetical protein
MATRKVSKFRLAVNGIGCILLAVLFLSVGIPGLAGLLSGLVHFGSDPDGGDKVLALQCVSVLAGAIALGSLVRTVIAWRGSDEE